MKIWNLLKTNLENLNEEWQSISTKMYQQTEEPSEVILIMKMTTTDVEYEEVK